jgi:DNA-binding LacI/PurR family transcriptional regulator
VIGMGYYNPPLTTVRQDFQAVGRRAIEMLVGQIESGSRTAEKAVIQPEPMVRRSTAQCSRTPRERP